MLTGTGIPFEKSISYTAILNIFKSIALILENFQFVMLDLFDHQLALYSQYNH